MRTVRCSDRPGRGSGGSGGGLPARRGVCHGEGMSARGCLPRRVCLPEGVSAQGQCVCQGGVYPGRCLHRGCLLGGVCWGCTPPPPVNRITDRCENITFPKLHLRMVTSRYAIFTLFGYLHKGRRIPFLFHTQLPK